MGVGTPPTLHGCIFFVKLLPYSVCQEVCTEDCMSLFREMGDFYCQPQAKAKADAMPVRLYNVH